MNNFTDRETELETLENEYARNESSLVILYGRRRVGKTSLCSEFIKNKHALYFLETEESETQNRNAFRVFAADFTGNTILKSAVVDNWDVIFGTVANTVTAYKKIIVIDEFQYLGRSNPAFLSVFQRIWDTILINNNVMVILCGSLVSMMESQTLNYGSPLYGRRTAQIKLKQIPFRYYHEFFPDKNEKDLIESYSVTGGVPKYIELFNNRNCKDIYDAIQCNVLNKLSFLYDEPNFLLQNEVTEVGSYFSLIKVIAAGNNKLSKISAALELPQTRLTKYLKTLIDLDILEREVPVTESAPEKSKKGLYKIKDNFILFWFKFIFPNLGYIESGNEQIVMDKIRSNFIDSHVSYVFENICREKMWSLAAEKRPGIVFNKVGRWWDNKDTEIDIVAVDDDGGNMIFGECKYWKKPVGINVLTALEEKAKAVGLNKNRRKEYYILFAAGGFTEDLQSLARMRDDIILII
jgi:AAA+ ATPase superfamily predicted ATPase